MTYCDRNEMLKDTLSLYEDALTDLENKFLAVDNGKLFSSPNAKYKWNKIVSLKDFYEKEISILRNELKV